MPTPLPYSYDEPPYGPVLRDPPAYIASAEPRDVRFERVLLLLWLAQPASATIARIPNKCARCMCVSSVSMNHRSVKRGSRNGPAPRPDSWKTSGNEPTTPAPACAGAGD